MTSALANLDCGAVSWRRLMLWAQYDGEIKLHPGRWSSAYALLWPSSLCVVLVSVLNVGASAVYLSFALVPVAAAWLLALALLPIVHVLADRPPRLCGRKLCIKCCPARVDGLSGSGRLVADCRVLRLPRLVSVALVMVIFIATIRTCGFLLKQDIVDFVNFDQARLDDEFTGFLLRSHPALQNVSQTAGSRVELVRRRTSLIHFLFILTQHLLGSKCDGGELLGSAHMQHIVEGSCDGTAVGDSCSAFSCMPGYSGGSITCAAYGSYEVQDCVASESHAALRVDPGEAQLSSAGIEGWLLRSAIATAIRISIVLVLTALFLIIWPSAADNIPIGDANSGVAPMSVIRRYIAKRAVEALALGMGCLGLLQAASVVLPLLLSATVAVLHFVPILGNYVALAVLCPFLTFDSSLTMGLRLAVFVAVMTMQLIIPWATGHFFKVELAMTHAHQSSTAKPITSIVAIVVATRVWGLPGSFMAIPILLGVRAALQTYASHPVVSWCTQFM